MLRAADADWDILHLLEHAFIHSWRQYLEEKNYHPALSGWIQGETFEDCVFIDAGFYQNEIKDLYEAYITSAPIIDTTLVAKSLADIKVEEKSQIDSLNMELLVEMVNDLSRSLPDGHYQRRQKSILQMQHTPDAYQDIAIALTAHNLSADEQKVFLRFKVILIDLIQYWINKNYSSYTQGLSPMTKHEDSISFISKVTFQKEHFNLEALSSDLQNKLRNFQPDDYRHQLDAHLKNFANEPLWKSLAVTYYQETGIYTSPVEIYNLASKESIKSILSKIHINTQVFDPTFDQWIS